MLSHPFHLIILDSSYRKTGNKISLENGYTHAIGITTSTAIAIRMDSVGIEFLYCCNDSPALGLFAMYWIFWIILFSNACNDVSFFSLTYKEDWNQSFQYPKLKNSPMVANTGFEIGTIIFKKIVNSEAPSIFADSTMESGIVDLKNVLAIMILNEDTASGNIRHQIVFLRFKILATTT